MNTFAWVLVSVGLICGVAALFICVERDEERIEKLEDKMNRIFPD